MVLRINAWFQSYLEDRTQICSIDGLLSSSCSLSCGVPQGTILGPLLFLLYINHLNCLSNCEPRMYADDTHLNYIRGQQYSQYSDKLRGRLRKSKSLEVTIDDNPDWGSLMEKIKKKVSSGIRAIKRVRHLVP